MFNDDIKERLRTVEKQLGYRPACLINTQDSVEERLDTLEEFMYAMKDWKGRVEEQLAVEEVTRATGDKEFLATRKKELRGYVNGQDDIDNE